MGTRGPAEPGGEDLETEGPCILRLWGPRGIVSVTKAMEMWDRAGQSEVRSPRAGPAVLATGMWPQVGGREGRAGGDSEL